MFFSRNKIKGLALSLIFMTSACLPEFHPLDLGSIGNEGPVLQIIPVATVTAVGETYAFTGLNGVEPYTYSVSMGFGSIDSGTGLYTAPMTPTTDTVRVTDSEGAFAEATIIVVPGLTITPTSVAITDVQTTSFSGVNGVSPYTFSVVSGGGSIDPNTGLYTPGSAPDSVVVRVTDFVGATADANVSVSAPLSLSPLSAKLSVGASSFFTAMDGTPPYTFSVVSGGGSIDQNTGFYTAPMVPGSAVVQVEDSFGSTQNANVTIVAPVKIASGLRFNCAVFTDGSLKCWGRNNYGQLGLGDTASRGDGANEMGLDLPEVDVGFGRTVVDVSLGREYACVLLDDGSVKCWGRNNYGQLGRGDVVTVGSLPGEMGNALTPIDLGSGRTAVAISAGYYHACALLDDDTVKCWGRGNYGQLGQGSNVNLGDGPDEMGDFLPAIGLGTGRTVKKIAAGGESTCAILDDATVKCWGRNNRGQLGIGNTATKGTNPAHMGDALLVASVGTGRHAVSISLGNRHVCVVLDNASLKCWGEATSGQVGLDTTAHVGNQANEMGDFLSAVNLGVGRTALSVASFWNHTCAVLDNFSVKCWGFNTYGELGQEHTTALGGVPGDMAALNAVVLGTGLAAQKVTTGQEHVCVILDTYQVKCWGRGNNGALGQGNTQTRGDQASEMGDNLAFTDL